MPPNPSTNLHGLGMRFLHIGLFYFCGLSVPVRAKDTGKLSHPIPSLPHARCIFRLMRRKAKVERDLAICQYLNHPTGEILSSVYRIAEDNILSTAAETAE